MLQCPSKPIDMVLDTDTYAEDSRRPLCRIVYHINRDALMGDLFNRLGQ